MARDVYLTSSSIGCKLSDLLPANRGRQSLVDTIIAAYGLHSLCRLVSVIPASVKELTSYHTRSFVAELLRERSEYDSECEDEEIQALQSVFRLLRGGRCDDLAESEEDLYGLRFDCPVFPFMNEYVKFVAGSSLCAANCLLTDDQDDVQRIAINWYGGRHHCLKNLASGFCYVNDIVLAILRLRTKFKRVSYVDLDLHHGDGVERAFQYSQNVTTCSVHMREVGFYPGTGDLESSQLGKYNIGLKRGLTDKNFILVIEQLVCPLIQALRPEVVVVQLGCDGLASDPQAQWNLTMEGYWLVSKYLMETFSNIPFLFLGGGGYNPTETAKCWAYLTKRIIGDELEWGEIPEHDRLEDYASDSFQFWTDRNTRPKVGRKDENTQQYLNEIKSILKEFW